MTLYCIGKASRHRAGDRVTRVPYIHSDNNHFTQYDKLRLSSYETENSAHRAAGEANAYNPIGFVVLTLDLDDSVTEEHFTESICMNEEEFFQVDDFPYLLSFLRKVNDAAPNHKIHSQDVTITRYELMKEISGLFLVDVTFCNLVSKNKEKEAKNG